MEFTLFLIFIFLVLFTIPIRQWVIYKNKFLAVGLSLFNVFLILYLRYSVNSVSEGLDENGTVILGYLFLIPLFVPLSNIVIIKIYKKLAGFNINT